MSNSYEKLSIAELRAIAKEKRISGYSAMKKQELVEHLTAAESQTSQEQTMQAQPMQAQPMQEQSPAKVAEATPAEQYTAEPMPQRNAQTVRRVVQGRDRVQSSDRMQYADRVQRPGMRPEGRPELRSEARTEARRPAVTPDIAAMDSGITREGILEVGQDQNFGFIRNDNYLPSSDDVYVSPMLIKRYNLSTGDVIRGNLKIKGPADKFTPLLYITKINGMDPELASKRAKFDKLTPIYPHERLHLETPGCGPAMRIVDLLSPIGKGQRGMIVSQPKAGKTTLLKQIAKAVTKNHPEVHLLILLIDERPEEVTDMKESITGKNVEVIYSTFDEEPARHKRVSEMTIERAKRLVEQGEDVVVLLDSITRLARAYNLTCQSSGRTLSGGLDPAALYMPKRFFGAARCMREGGSLTILATALVDTGSRMDDVVFEEFKGTGNMELVLDRTLSEKRIFPAIDLPKSSTRREDLLLTPLELEANFTMRRAFNGAKADEAVEQIVNMFARTKDNQEFIQTVKKLRLN